MPRSGRKLKIAGNSLRYHGFNEAGAIMPRSGRHILVPLRCDESQLQ